MYASAAAATYPERMNQAIARAILALAQARAGVARGGGGWGGGGLGGGRPAACVEAVDVEARRKAVAPLWQLLHSVQTERQCSVQEAESKSQQRKRKSGGEVEEPGRLANGVQPTLFAMFPKRPAP